MYGPGGELLGEHFVGQASGVEWVGMVARSLLVYELANSGSGMSTAEMVEDVARELRAWEQAADEAERD